MDGIKGRLAKGAAWITVGRLVTNVLALTSTFLLARLLIPADFGLVALAWTVISIVNALSEISVSAVLVQHPQPTRDHFNTVWTLSALRAAMLALLLVGISTPVAWAFNEPHLPPVLQALAVATFLAGLQSPRRIFLTRDLVFWQLAFYDIGQKLAGLIVAAVCAFTFRSYWALVAGSIATDLTGLLISYIVAPYRPRVGLRHWRDMFGYSVWLMLSQAVSTLNWRFDNLLIGAVLGKTALGHFTVGDNLASLPTREAIAPLTSTLFPAFSHVQNNRKADLASAYQSAQALVTMIALPVGIGVALLAEPLVRLAMTDKWLPTVVVIQALSAVFALQTLGSLSHPLAMATGDTRLLFKRDVQSFLLRLPSVVIGIWLGGLAGVAIARAVAGVIGIAFNLQVVRQVIGLPWLDQLRPNIRTLASAAVMTAVVLTTREAVAFGIDTAGLIVELWLLSAIGAVTFIGTQLLLWRLGGEPKGPETDFHALLRRLLAGRGPSFLRRWA